MKNLLVPFALALGLTLAAPVATAQTFDIQPASADVVAGEPLQIVLSGLPPGAAIDILAESTVTDFLGRRRYGSQARFVADAQGRVDLATQAPVSGSYAGADLRGLFWSRQPLAGAASVPAGEVQLQARQGDRELAVRRLRIRQAAADLQWRDAAPFAGARLALRPGTGRRPAVIALGGSEGGSAGVLHSAALLASHGFVVLGLPYYSPPTFTPAGPGAPELPALPPAFADIPLDRLEAAHRWLAQQPEVDPDRIALFGVSKGAEFVLAAASRMGWPKSVVALVPSDVVWEGWGPGVEPGRRSSFAWRGEPLPFVPYVDFAAEFRGFQTGEPVIVRRPQDKGRAAHPERVAAARIPVERYAGPLLVAGSHDDQVWDSGGMAEAIAKARAGAGRETVLLVYGDAGHALSGTGWAPTTQYNAGPMKMGGSPAGAARAQAETWARTLDFLKATLSR